MKKILLIGLLLLTACSTHVKIVVPTEIVANFDIETKEFGIRCLHSNGSYIRRTIKEYGDYRLEQYVEDVNYTRYRGLKPMWDYMMYIEFPRDIIECELKYSRLIIIGEINNVPYEREIDMRYRLYYYEFDSGYDMSEAIYNEINREILESLHELS